MSEVSGLEALSRTIDDLVLELLIEIPEVVGVSRYTDDEILVVIRMLLSLKQRLFVENVELDVVAVH